tara:strand:+ start:2750 stop:3022 length:273 start_codon:yes stop_codon:yes gene_type:complete
VAVTKKSLVKYISKKLELSQKDSSFFLESFLSAVKDNAKAGINIQNFGTFSLKKTPERVGRDPKSKKQYVIKARQKLAFTPSTKIKQEIN